MAKAKGVSYKDFTEKTPKVKAKEKTYKEGTPTEWWKHTDQSEALTCLKQMVGQLSTPVMDRMARYRVAVRLYGTSDLFGQYYRASSNSVSSLWVPDRLSANVVQANVDTLTSKMSKIKPRAKFLTNLGTYRAQKAAKKMTYMTDGIFAENATQAIGRDILRDALVLGDGIVQVVEKNNRVAHERVLPYEIFVDETECLSGKPTHMYRVKLVSRQDLMDQYPDKATQIQMTSKAFTSILYSGGFTTDLIEVCEGWHIPNDPSKKAVYIKAVADYVLSEGIEEYPMKEFPFARLQWTAPFAGYWSQSLAEQLKPTQLELNKLLAIIQRSYHLAGSFKIFLQNGSQVNPAHLNNEIGTIINYTGTRPDYVTPPIVPPEMYQQVDRLKMQASQISGVSSLSAMSEKPAGLNSGVALREYSDIETSRFMDFSQDYEKFFTDLARISISKARSIADKNDGSYPISSPSSKALTKLDLKEIELSEKDYTVNVFPASSLPNEPAGRLAAIDDLVQRGLLDPTEQRELLNFPDIEANSQLSNAQYEHLTEVFDKMLMDGKYTSPDAYMNLALARKMALQFYALGHNLNVEDDKLELIRQFISELDVLQAPAVQTPAVPSPEMGIMNAPAEMQQLTMPASASPFPIQ